MIDFDEDVELSWRTWLADFKSEVYPVFEQAGVSLDTALLLWNFNRLKNVIEDRPSF